MTNQELAQRISTHQDIIAELNRLSPSVEAYNMRISQFLLKHPSLLGLSYRAAEILIEEKDPGVSFDAIEIIGKEIKTRRDPDSPGYQLRHQIMTETRVRKILSECRPQSEKEKPTLKAKTIPIDIVCPHCRKEVRCIPEKRREVVAFKGTIITDDIIERLAEKCGVSRSFMINELLKIKGLFGYSLKK